MEHMTLKPYSCMLARARAGGGSGAKFTIRTAALDATTPRDTGHAKRRAVPARVGSSFMSTTPLGFWYVVYALKRRFSV